MSATPKPKVTVILANLGTPDEATAPAVRRFLKQFLSDTRVIEIPKFIWWVILHAFVLPFRPKRVAQAYATVWSTDSPMREIVLKQTQLIKQRLLDENHQFDLTVVPAMTYGQPSIYAVFEQLEKVPQEHVILLPLFPQYSATSTAPLYDAFARWIPNQRHLPGITMIKDYYQHPLFIQALVDSVLAYQEQHGKPEKLLMSFHGIPQPYADKGDPYADRCRMTAKLVAEALHLNEDEWAISFQSRFGKQEWVKPYTDVLLEQWGQAGVRSVQVLSPAFSADCLETLEELAVENKETFQHAGGGEYAYIPALNTDQAHIDLLASLVQANLDALTHTLAHR
ncbi:ferrochelatase [Acinetobacter junii]|jgi:ferrochelatase|uniref:ferrochelatase n=1 Tax=Acinetobacter junii TaxID=40215 RepID=UPI0002D07260|nr:ferrochelatase [Acinetobacter junii]MBQ1494157.1 ferrochelatase [Acinetobacter sp.]ENV68249.1 ferrochelatase [Acinetobacter junii CIP 64.5]MDH0717675.1 ferrochelatase [Acinetobacter junii]MDH1375062.1 ferrochelatase [Acinetobacter junii]SSX90254.1 hemH [Acinetobacter junii]